MTSPSELKRSLSLTLLTLYGLGTILGAGIYVLVGKVAVHAGAYVPAAFLVAALLTVFTALSYGELAARYPRSGGEAVYVQAGFGRPWLATLVGFLLILTGVVSAATLVNGFVGYFAVFVEAPRWLVIAGLVALMGGLAAWGISESVRVAAAITVIEVGGLVFLLIVTGDRLLELPARLPELLPPAQLAVWEGILLGAFLAFYAYIGFEDMVNVAEEVREPVRNLPRAILLALAVATVLYLLVALAAVLALPADELARSEAPFALLYTRATGEAPTLISLIGLFAVANGVLIQIIMASRILYGMSREGWLPPAFGRVHARTRTPLTATAWVVAVLGVLALWLPLVTLARITSFITLVTFSLLNLSLLRVKRREPPVPGAPCFPFWVPLAGFLCSAGFVMFQIAQWLRP